MSYETVESWSKAPIQTDDINGANYQIVKMDYGLPGLTVPAGLLIDAFGRMRVSDPTTIFDSQFQYDLQPFLWEADTTTGSTITHDPNQSAAVMVVTNVSDTAAILQTYQYHRYQPGKSQFIAMTFNLEDQQAGATKRVGYFDGDNGFYLEATATGVAFGRRSKASGTVIDTLVEKASWNLDPLDGNGHSGYRLDLSKTQILVINFQWLGVGACVMGFDIDGSFVPCHQWRHANNLATPYMTTANLPLRYELTRTGTLSAATLLAICNVVMSEGGFEADRGINFGAGQSVTGVSVTSRRATFSIRATATLNGVVNRGQIIPESFDIGVASGSVYFEVVYNPTFASTVTWASVSTGNSIAEFCSHATATSAVITGGVVLYKGYAFGPSTGVGSRTVVGGLLNSKLPITLTKDGDAGACISIVCAAVSGTPDVWSVIDWRELR